ncbi:MAG: hypothetical protein FJY20_12590 [Bacteroidetes bacterium]|nr:hypothetical protein [Bacteroidota bacterium]
MSYITIEDWISGFILILIILGITNRFVKKNKTDPLIVRYFKIGIILKISGGIAFTIYYAYVYAAGDTFGFFLEGKAINNILISDPSGFFNFLFLPINKNIDAIRSFTWIWGDPIMTRTEENYFQIRLSAFILPATPI